jgi:hypothetical protein
MFMVHPVRQRLPWRRLLQNASRPMRRDREHQLDFTDIGERRARPHTVSPYSVEEKKIDPNHPLNGSDRSIRGHRLI